MKRILKTTIASALVLSMALSGATAAVAATPAAEGLQQSNCIATQTVSNWAKNVKIKLFNKSEYAKYNPGVTVEKDENSPTGYYAVFVFDEDSLTDSYKSYIKEQYGVDLNEKLDLNNLAQVQIYSNTALLFSYDTQAAGVPLDPANAAYTPDQYTEGLYPAGGDTSKAWTNAAGTTKVNYYADMTKFAEGRWGVKIPLTSGATDYNIRLVDVNGVADGTYLYDPANAPMQNTASGVYSRSSMVYVPYSEKMGTGTYSDRTVENPREDGKTGEMTFASYVNADGETRYLGVYLPYGYDANRTEPYNVLYMSHGAQSEQLGSEMRWLNECAVQNITDNLNGDFVVVTMNNVDLKWNQDKIWTEQQNIMSFVESNYNVGKEQKNRAYCGFSMGGRTASYMYVNHADQFGYVGIWSYAANELLDALDADGWAKLAAQGTKVSVGAGDWDYLLSFCTKFSDSLKAHDIDNTYFTVPGSHDWRTWQAMYAYAVQNLLWK
ncbi:alpha/beta hydrolase [Faecalibacterium tardum]|uniref:Alpha/beta hydrolase-fold protein n=1 Tax=Faecalibacterium tardum TaxID=3133156 RepID=A0ABV1ATF4_9FIRM